MQHASKFEVDVTGYHSAPAEWRRAFEATPSELPSMTDQEREVAKRFQVSEDDYRRGKLAGILAGERLKSRGRQLGEQVERILRALGDGYELKAVLWSGEGRRWVLRIQTPHTVVAVGIAFELADDVLDSGAVQDIEGLENLVLLGVGREELIRRSGA